MSGITSCYRNPHTRKPGVRALLCATAVMLASLFLAANATAQETPADITMVGKTALVTGSTDGLGREVALRLGEMGAHVIVHGRSEERGLEMVGMINQGAGSAEFISADFGSLAEARALAAAVIGRHDELHLLINNAGIGPGFNNGERAVSEDGNEMILQVNHLAHFVLTDLLLPMIKESAPARIINVASGAQSPIDFNDVNMEQDFDSSRAYAQSKLAQILHNFHIAPQLEGTGVTFNSLHPATMMDTTLVSQMAAPPRTTVDEGAEAVMYLAISSELEGRSGLYFNGKNEARANDQAYDKDALERFDQLSRQLTDLE